MGGVNDDDDNNEEEVQVVLVVLLNVFKYSAASLGVMGGAT